MKKVLFLTALLLVCISLLVACSTGDTTAPATTAATKPPTTTTTSTTTAPASQTGTTDATTIPASANVQYGGTLRILDKRLPTASLGYPPNILNHEVQFLYPAIETLWQIKKDGSVQPMLATSWEVSPDQKSLTIKLRQDVKFHDGTEFDAEAAKWNLEEVMKAKLPGTLNWASIDVLDKYTVRINLSYWENLIFINLSKRPGMMVSPTAIQKNGVEWANTNIAATGPFTLSKFERDTALEFKRFDGYWKEGKPYLDEIKYRCIPNVMTQLASFQAGEADLLAPTDGQVLSELKKMPNVVFLYRPSGINVIYPDSANDDSPFSKKEVRMALEYAIDKENLMKLSGFGIFEPAYQMASEATIGYIPDIQPRKYDLAKAKELMSQAGYPNGFTCTLTITNTAPSTKDTQVALADFLSKLGITCTLEYADPAKYADYQIKGWHNTIIYSPANIEGSFSSFVQIYYFTDNYYVSLKEPPDAMDLYTESLSSTNIENSKVQALARAFFDDVSLIPISYMGTGQVHYDYVHDTGFLDFNAQTTWSPENCWMSK